MEVISDPNAATNTGSYSPALKFGPFVMVSGQGPISPDGEIVSGSIEEETRLTMNNIKKYIEAAGATMDQIVKCNCFLEKMSEFEAFDAVYREFFKETFPCRTTVAAGLLDITVEIAAMAYIG
jgi:2-iminobutanoate/2-iminopropanoate deaminase